MSEKDIPNELHSPSFYLTYLFILILLKLKNWWSFSTSRDINETLARHSSRKSGSEFAKTYFRDICRTCLTVFSKLPLSMYSLCRFQKTFLQMSLVSQSWIEFWKQATVYISHVEWSTKLSHQMIRILYI